MEIKIGERFFSSIFWPWTTAKVVGRWILSIPGRIASITMDAENLDDVALAICIISSLGIIAAILLWALGIIVFGFLVLYLGIAGTFYSLKLHGSYIRHELKGQKNYKGNE